MLNRGVEGLRPPFREWGGAGRGGKMLDYRI